MSDRELAAFNEFLYQSIPVVRFMQLQLISCSENKLTARAPSKPNLNDKQTIFGGSSAALMTVCGWSLIKFNLEQRKLNNDVVIAHSEINWQRAQTDDLIITAQSEIDWTELINLLNDNQTQPKIKLSNQVGTTEKQACTIMTSDYVILNNTHD